MSSSSSPPSSSLVPSESSGTPAGALLERLTTEFATERLFFPVESVALVLSCRSFRVDLDLPLEDIASNTFPTPNDAFLTSSCLCFTLSRIITLPFNSAGDGQRSNTYDSSSPSPSPFDGGVQSLSPNVCRMIFAITARVSRLA